ncbi:MAG: histidinol-phosphate transaminase [Candidatus Roizmanbacteria bacterium]|nr:histidinol-phosphate transaminase [Candidatus Roizmanbacteria bacterium]
MKKFNLSKALKSHILKLEPYMPGRQVGKKAIRLNANESQLPPTSDVQKAMRAAVNGSLRFYPEENSKTLRQVASHAFGVPADNIVADSGSSSLLSTLFRITLEKGDVVVSLTPTFSLYKTLASIEQAEFVGISLADDSSLPINQILKINPKLIVIANPNSPTGQVIPINQIDMLLKQFPRIVIIDEAYAEFAGISAVPLLRKHKNLIVVKTFSKSQSLAGMRIAFALATKELIECIDKVRPTYNMNTLSQVAAIAALKNWGKDMTSVKDTKKQLTKLVSGLFSRGFKVTPSKTNFVLVKVPDKSFPASKWEETLRKNGILVRYFSSEPKLKNFLRISVGTTEEIDDLFRVIDRFI